MTDSSHALARALTHAFRLLRAVTVVGLVVLIPAMLFAAFSPQSLFPGGGVRINGDPITDVHRNAAWLLLLVAIVFLAAGMVILGRLTGVMRSVQTGTPFEEANAVRLRTIAMTMAGLVVFQLVFGLALSAETRAAFDIPLSRFDGGLFLGALVVLVLAEVFREGARLATEVEETI